MRDLRHIIEYSVESRIGRIVGMENVLHSNLKSTFEANFDLTIYYQLQRNKIDRKNKTCDRVCTTRKR